MILVHINTSIINTLNLSHVFEIKLINIARAYFLFWNCEFLFYATMSRRMSRRARHESGELSRR